MMPVMIFGERGVLQERQRERKQGCKNRHNKIELAEVLERCTHRPLALGQTTRQHKKAIKELGPPPSNLKS